MPHTPKKSLPALLTLALLAAASPSFASPPGAFTSTSWTQTTDANWSDPANWSDGVPTSSTDALFPLNATLTVTLPDAASANNLLLTAGQPTFDSGSLSLANLHVGGDGSSSTGPATLTINPDATLTVAGTTKVWNDSSRISLNAGSLITGSLDLGNSSSRLDWITNTSPGLLQITNSNISLDSTGPIGPTLTLTGGRSFIVSDTPGGSVTGTLTLPNAANLTLSGGQLQVNILDHTNSTGAFNYTSGTLFLTNASASNSLPGFSSLTVPASGVFLSNAGLTLDSLTVNGFAEIFINNTDAGTSKLNSLTLAGTTNNWSGELHLSSNSLIVQATSLNKSAALQTLRNQVLYGQTHSAGISGFFLPANTTLAVIDNGDLPHPFTTFAGQDVDNNSILITPILLGDANADNHVDGADFDIWFTHLLATSNAYEQGDFNQDGHIDGADFDIWFTHLLDTFGGSDPTAQPFPGFTPTQLSELAQFLSPSQMASLPAAIPEPTTITLLTFAMFTLIRRRHPKV